MTGFRARFVALQAAATYIAAISQLQGTVNGPLLTTTLAPSTGGGAAPFVSSAQALPLRAVASVGESWSSPVILTTPAIHALPSGRHDGQPNPTLSTFQTQLRGFVSSPPLSLTVTPAEAFPSGRHSGDDQPNPSGPRHVHAGVVGAPSLSLLTAPAPELPTGRHAGDHQPNPLIPPPLHRGVTESSSLSLLYTEPPEIGAVFRGPLITRWAKRPHPVDLLTIAPPSFMARGPISMQLRGGDWPNPRGYPFPLALRTWAHSFILFGESSPAVPSHHADPNPHGPRFPTGLLTWTQNLLQTTLLPAPETPPVGTRGRVEGVPPGPAYVVTLRTWEQHLQQTTLVPPPEPIPDGKPMPGWPNPRGYPFPNANLGYVQQPSQDLLAQPPPVEEDLELIIRLGVVTEKVIRLGVVTEKVIRLKVGH